MRFTASNGENGLNIGFNGASNNTPSQFRIAYIVNTTPTKVSTNFSTAQWHDIVMTYANGKQSVSVDGTEYLSNNDPSLNTAWMTNAIRLDGAWYSKSEFYISEMEISYARV